MIETPFSNFLYKAAIGKEATVAFLGGSITEMKGWCDMVKDSLSTRWSNRLYIPWVYMLEEELEDGSSLLTRVATTSVVDLSTPSASV